MLLAPLAGCIVLLGRHQLPVDDRVRVAPTLRRELWERRFGPSQLATDACQFKSNQTTLTELAAVALVHLDNLEELERRLGASGAAYLFAYLYAYRLVRWRVEPLDPRRAH